MTDDERYLKPLAPALDWFERSRLPDGQYARFYELQTNKPLYCVAGTYELTYDDSNTPRHYAFKNRLVSSLENLKEQLGKPREEQLIKRTGPTKAKSWKRRADNLVEKVQTSLKTQHPNGYWLQDGLIDAGLFVKHMQAMTSYVEARRHQ